MAAASRDECVSHAWAVVSSAAGHPAADGMIVEPTRRLSRPLANDPSPDALVTREWIVTNGLGGYASGTISGVITRRYHGLLIAALPAPLGRIVMLNHLSERLRLADNRGIWLGGEERAGGSLDLPGAPYLKEFRLEEGLP